MARASKIMAASAALLALSGGAALADNAVTTAPTNIHAARNGASAIVGTIRAAETVSAANCRKGWCAAAGGYVRSATLRFARAAQRGRKEYESYDYNVPLALPPYGYTPGFWGYGGRRYYDRFGNYTKYGQGGIPEARADSGLIETIPRSRLR